MTEKYKDRITFFDNVEVTDGQGGGTLTASNVIKVWANVKPLKTFHQLQFSQITTAQGYEIECLELKANTVTSNSGILYKTKTLTIHSLVEDNNRLKIIAFEK